jgi:hypothetical protein
MQTFGRGCCLLAGVTEVGLSCRFWLSVWIENGGVSQVSQILTGIEVIKAYCWDAPFIDRLTTERDARVLFCRESGCILIVFFNPFEFLKF